jgi:hypothetical protein
MKSLLFLLAGVLMVSVCRADEPDIAALTELHAREARGYALFLDSERKQLCPLDPEPIFKWQNTLENGGQLGLVYVWSDRGRPVALGTMFSQRDFADPKRRVVVHEFHTLAPQVLTVQCPTDVLRQWKPRGKLTVSPLADAPPVSDKPAQRLLQLRELAREFTVVTHKQDERVELRLAPRPLHRYQPQRDDVQDGALFAFLSNAAGTDPEVIVLLEARRATDNPAAWQWHAGIVRFTDRDFVVTRKDREVFSSLKDNRLKAIVEDQYRWIHTPDDAYFVFQAKFVPEGVAGK